jgi:CDP-glucose 4,6-dehydratase
MEDVGMNFDFWKGRRVFLTGHTGFKGSWLTLWLHRLGAEIYGYSLNPPTEPNLFTVAEVERCMAVHKIADVCDRDNLCGAIQAARPEIIFHMAAQPLVRYSYAQPLETYSVNVMGTVHLFEAVRRASSVKAVVNITTDKCYENREWVWPYRENEPMGGYDPYSSSKGCSELITAAYRRSFFDPAGICVASARAGNVIGGGDWSTDRLIPDILQSISENKKVMIRNPHSIRPWQFVLEPLRGYLLLAEKLYTDGERFADAWNFGPSADDVKSVQWIVETLLRAFGKDGWWTQDPTDHPHEANSLRLDCSKAKSLLKWEPGVQIATALQKIEQWHRAYLNHEDMKAFSIRQIAEYQERVECSSRS